MYSSFNQYQILEACFSFFILLILCIGRLYDRKNTSEKSSAFDALLVTALTQATIRTIQAIVRVYNVSTQFHSFMMVGVYVAIVGAAYHYIMFASPILFDDTARIAIIRRITLTCAIFSIIIICLVAPTGYFFYYINGIYYIGKYYILSLLFPLITNLWISVAAFRSNISIKHKFDLCAYFIFLVLSIILQKFMGGPSLLGLAVTLAAVVVYTGVYSDTSIDLSLAEKRIAEEKVRILMLQMKPHFIYNTLSSIQQLCIEAPSEAEKALEDFTEYLRGNMDNLTNVHPVPFAKELDLTRHYINLERYRFGDRVRVSYDIAVRDFCLPSATLQPIVENSVRYGACATLDGCDIIISTRETDKEYILKVEDNGPGFDIELLRREDPADSRSHIGLSNVKERIYYLSKGRIEIASAPGKGCVSTVVIPKHEEGNVKYADTRC